MTTNFNSEELNEIQEAAQTAENTQAQEPVPAEEPAQDPAQTSLTMTVDQSIYAVVEPGTAPLLRTSTTTDSSKLFNALNGNADTVKDWIGEEVDVTAIVVTSADVPSIMGDEDSERVCKPCVHFFTLDGSHISSISNGIIRATKMLLACGLTPTEDEPIRIVFKEIKTKKGTAHSFDMV